MTQAKIKLHENFVTNVFDTQDEFGLRWHATQQFQTRMFGPPTAGELITHLRESAAKQMAREVCKKDGFFNVAIDSSGFGVQHMDCVVLTQEEYASALQKQFKAGVQHASGFMNYKD